MDLSQRIIIEWACLRAAYLDKVHRYEDGYAVSQEFYEWTTLFNVDHEIFKAEILKVPTFDKENRTG